MPGSSLRRYGIGWLGATLAGCLFGCCSQARIIAAQMRTIIDCTASTHAGESMDGAGQGHAEPIHGPCVTDVLPGDQPQCSVGELITSARRALPTYVRAERPT